MFEKVSEVGFGMGQISERRVVWIFKRNRTTRCAAAFARTGTAGIQFTVLSGLAWSDVPLDMQFFG